MKRLLIISPYFPPVNAADMQRVRMSLPYFRQFGWETEVVTVDPRYADAIKDELLTKTIPGDIKIHYVKALDKGITSKLGLGSIALRSLYFYRLKVNALLEGGKFDLIYFSTTQFPVCILGAYWKKKFRVPYVIDMQDPWFSNYYEDKPKSQRPPKYWFSYRLNKTLEPIAMKKADGLISVSEDYITELKLSYPVIKDIPAATITFGATPIDIEVAKKHESEFTDLLVPEFKNIVYVGRGGADMREAIIPLFKTLKQGLVTDPESFGKLRLYFIGTSYAPAGTGIPSILPIAKEFGLQQHVTEITDRISYFHTLSILNKADALFIPGSDDPRYTASKIFPYLLTGKPLLAILHQNSPAHGVLAEYGALYVYNYADIATVENAVSAFLLKVSRDGFDEQKYDAKAVKKYTAEELTRKQCDLFNLVLNAKN